MQDKASLAEKAHELYSKMDKPWVSPVPCERCGGKIYGGDGYLCRCCDPVERINALAEKEAEYWLKEIPLGADRHWGAHWIYAECADIILDSEE